MYMVILLSQFETNKLNKIKANVLVTQALNSDNALLAG